MKKIIPVFVCCTLIPLALRAEKYSDGNDAEGDERKGYTIEETTELMKNSQISKIMLDHDDHVYKCMKIAKEGKNLEGAVEALVSFKTRFGDTLDNEEVQLVIDISRLNTPLYSEIALQARNIGKKKTTVEEHQILVRAMKDDSGKALLRGIERAAQCKYRIENDYFTKERIDLLVKVGNLQYENRFFEICDAMRIVGMGGSLNSRGLELLYKLYLLKGNVSGKIVDYLKVNKWKSRKEPGNREYEVIRDLMYSQYAAFTEGSKADGGEDDTHGSGSGKTKKGAESHHAEKPKKSNPCQPCSTKLARCD